MPNLCSSFLSLANRSYHADSTDQFRWEHKYYPVYYFKSEDLSSVYLQPSETSNKNEDTEVEIYDMVVGDRVANDVVTKFSKGDVAGLVKIEQKAMDAWFEEDEQIWNHPKDPYKVCACPLSRRI
jgi:hypothetical protein